METVTVLNQMSFWLFALLVLGGALGVVFHRSIVYSAIFLLVTFLAIAGVFVMLNAPFIAAGQVLVYGVGLTIVMIFGIMLTGDKPFVDPVGQERPARFWILPGIAAMGFVGFMLWSLLMPNVHLTQINGLFITRVDALAEKATLEGLQAITADGGVTYIAQMLFSKYLVPFELASILLLLAMIGAILLAKREFPEEEGEVLPVSSASTPTDDGDACAMNPDTAGGVSTHEPQPVAVGAASSSSDEAAVGTASVEKETLGVS